MSLTGFGTSKSSLIRKLFCDTVKEEVRGKNRSQTWAILAKFFVWSEKESVWNEKEQGQNKELKEYKLVGLKLTYQRE